MIYRLTWRKKAARRPDRRLRLLFEPLENRQMMAVDWRNPVDPLDVNADGIVAPLDALRIINDLNANGSRQLALPRSADASYLDVTGDQFSAPLDVLQVINSLNDGITGPRRLTEGSLLAAEVSVPITLGQSSGARIYRAQIDASFDTSATEAVLEDVLAVYLVDPQQPTQTILDRGDAGTALFTLAGTHAEFAPGLVRWDGSVLTIDTTSLAPRDTGVLKFQLLNSDSDRGTRVTIKLLTNEVDPDGAPSLAFLDDDPPVAAGGALDLGELAPNSTFTTELGNVHFSASTGRYAAELRLTNDGPSVGHKVAVAFPGLPAGVTLINPSGTTATGSPYLNVQPAIAPGGLGTGSRSDAVTIAFDDPAQTPFALTPQILAGTNHAPTLAPIGPLTTSPGGVLRVQLLAADQDGDTVTFAIRGMANLPTGTLRADGTLVFRPAPNQVGTYTFDIVARDGELEATQSVTMHVVADPLVTTRVSGQVLQIDGQPLANMPVEIGGVQGLTMPDGSFTLNLGSGPPVSDTLKVRGELFPGPLVYPFIAEKLAFILDHDVYASVNNVIDRPIFLPALDVADGTAIVPTQDTLVRQEVAPGEMVEVFVATGTLMNQLGTPFTGTLSITEVPPNLTPAALPPNLFPDLVVTVQPGEMVFAAPAPMTFPNRSGWAPGTLMDLWSINPVTGEFDDVGDMQVSADGSVIETISGGVRNSSWHFPAPRPITPKPRPPAPPCDNCEESAPANSTVSLNSGAITEEHELASYSSLGETRAVTLHYDSLRADPRPVFSFGYDSLNANIFSVPDALRIVAKLSVNVNGIEQPVPGFDPFAGNRTEPQFGLAGGEHFWSIPPGDGPLTAALQADLRDVPTGIYEYTLESGLRGFTGTRLIGSASIQTDRFVHVNTSSSPFGAGWGLAGLQEIVTAEDGSVLIIDDDGRNLLFTPPAVAGQPFVPPPGDFSRLVRLPDGTYRQTFPDQTVYTYNTQNKLVNIRDRNGNETRHEYDVAGNLLKIVDPVGLETTLTYTNGRVGTITDPAGRVTQLTYDAAGNMIRVTDPDGTSRTWEYDADHHMVAEVNQRANREQSFYDEFGRSYRSVHTDGSTSQVIPAQVRGLYRLDQNIDPSNSPSAARTNDGQAFYLDANGNSLQSELDAAGQEVQSRDAVGILPTVERNAQNLITRETDARGHATDYTYDDRGNVLTINDAITADVGQVLLADNFDIENGGKGVFDYTGFGNWNVTRNGVDLIGNGLADIYPGHGLFLDMAGTFGISGRLESKTSFALTPGTYELSFSLGNNAGGPNSPNALLVTLGSEFNETFTVTGSVPLQTVTRTITVTTTTQASLVFDHTASESFGPVIDDVKLRRVQPRRFTYDPTFSQVTSDTDELGHQTLFDIDPANGNMRSITQVIGVVGGPDDLVTQYTYTSLGLVDTETDPLGRVTDYDYDALGLGRLVTVTMAKATADEGVRHFEYDAAGNLTAAIDENGLRTDYVYDALNRVTRITEPDPDAGGPLARPVTAFTYDAAGNLTSTTDVRGNTTRSEYDSLDRPTKTIDPNASETGYRYDLAGNLTSVTNPLGHETRYRYDARDRLVETTDPDNGRTKFRYDADDNTTAVTDPVGNVTRHSYDSRDRLVRETDPFGSQTAYAYDAVDNLVRRTESEPTTTTTNLQFDNFADRSGWTLNGVATAINATPVTFNGQVVLRLTTNRNQAATAFLTEPVLPSIADLTSFSTSFQFQITATEGIISDEDGVGADGFTFLLATSPTKLGGHGGGLGILGIGPSVAVEFDTHNNGLPSDGSGNHVGIDLNGNQASIVQASVSPRLNDGNVWFAWIDYSDATQQLEVRVAQTSQRPAEPVVAATVDLAAVLGQNNAFVGFSAGTGGGGSQKHDIRSWQFTAAHTSITARRQIEFAYDDVDRRTSETWVGGGNTMAYAYDQASNLLSATDSFSGLAMTYDSRDRVQTVDNAGTPGVPNVVLTYAYDPAGNRLSSADTIAGAAGGLNSYTYDGLDRITRITQSGMNVSKKRVDLAYNPLGQFSALQRFQDLAGTQLVIGSNYTYDSLNRLVGLHHSTAANSDVSFFDFVYDAHSRVTRITDIDGATDYAYDDRDELTAANHADVNNPDETYTYDANGNRLTSSRHGNGYVTGPNNRLLSDGTFDYAYDPEGNLVRRTEIATGKFRELQWDYRNRLTSVIDKTAANVEIQRVAFNYDVFDRRLSRAVDTTPLDAVDAAVTSFVYDGQDVLLDFVDADGSGPTVPVLTQRYLHGPAVDQVLAQDNGTGSVLWHLSDHLGTVRDLANNSGTVVNHLTYDSFGNVIAETNPAIDTRYQFTGREFDAELGLHYYRARFYDSGVGRFLSEDPIGFAGGQTNLYSYVNNRLVSHRDPSGLSVGVNPTKPWYYEEWEATHNGRSPIDSELGQQYLKWQRMYEEEKRREERRECPDPLKAKIEKFRNEMKQPEEDYRRKHQYDHPDFWPIDHPIQSQDQWNKLMNELGEPPSRWPGEPYLEVQTDVKGKLLNTKGN